jgi:hypothetical protein
LDRHETRDQLEYARWLEKKQQQWDMLCRHCGACCGAFEDPCAHLMMTPEGKSSCKVYMTRLGLQKTVSGVVFDCVSIRQKMGDSWPGDEQCPYKKQQFPLK